MTQQIKPRQAQTEPEVGLSNQGVEASGGGHNRPKPLMRSLTRAEWKEKFRSERAARGPNWGIPTGGMPVSARIGRSGIKVPAHVQLNPDVYYFDPQSSRYKKRIGSPQPPGQGHVIPCFAKGTYVATPTGPRPIELLQKGETIYAFASESGEVVVRQITQTHRNMAKCFHGTLACREIKTVKGRVLATADHLFWVAPGEWVAAKDLVPLAVLRTITGDSVKVISKDKIVTKATRTYNLSVDVDQNYFVGPDSLLVHNSGPHGIYEAIDPATNEVVYVGQTNNLAKRQSEHRAEGRAPNSQNPWKANLILKWAKGSDGLPLTGLTKEEAWYWERKIYDQHGGPKLSNKHPPYSDQKMRRLINKYCP